MRLGAPDVLVFLGFVAAVMTVGLSKSRREKTSEDYFLAGRGLSWWLIGFSLIAANISTEQFVGMSGNAASHAGVAIASYEWMAAITLVVVAFGFLPYFLRAGIFTMPEFLEYRYNALARTIMAVATMLIYMLLLGSVTYSGALTISTVAAKMGYDVDLYYGSLALGLIAMAYVAAGGLKACAWADLIQGSALIVGGGVVMVFAFAKLGGATEATYVQDVETGVVAVKTLAEDAGAFERFFDLNAVRLNMFLPASDPVLPWTALIVGLWIPNFYYWGLNQYITQRTLGSASLSQGQRGIVFAAFLKLLIPLIIVIPGIIAFNLFSKEMRLQTIADNASILIKYSKANPSTQFMSLVESPSQERIETWQPGRYMIALFESEEALAKVTPPNAFVLPVAKAAYEATEVGAYTIFESDDKAWESVHARERAPGAPSFTDEVKAYNVRTRKAAEAAGASTSKEKPIAYKYDTALGQLLGNVLPQGVGVVGFVLAALLGAVVSSIAAMLNAASTIFSMDVFRRYIAPRASQKAVVSLGRICVGLFTVIAVILAPQLGNPNIRNSIFTIIQESQGFISPGILSVFVFGFIVRRGPPLAGVMGLLTSIVSYGFFMLAWPGLQFLNRMAVSFGLCLAIMALVTWMKPLAQPVEFKRQTTFDLSTSKGALVAGILVVILTLALYVIFSPIGLAR